MQKGQIFRGGFALPTVLISSVVMLIVLAVSVSSVAAVRTSLKVQYYEQLAKVAGEAGVAYAKACLAKNGNVALWTDSKPLTPATDCAGNQLLGPAVQVLAVGGGGGGANNHGGGGGGGGVTQSEAIPVSVGSYSITVGAGGAGGSGSAGAAGANGGNSSFSTTLVALGGGGGGGRIADNSVTQAKNGGSGGGGAGTRDGGTSLPAKGGLGDVDQGNDGGNGSSGTSAPFAGNGGGGGGAGDSGGVATGTTSGAGVSGNGGIGLLSDITGQQVYYGAGGSGGRWFTGDVGTGGITGGGTGGAADSAVGSAGQANTGGGGGGGGGASANGGNGGSGVVVIRYANNGSITATGGSPYISGPYKVHRLTASATFSVSATSTSSCPSDPRCSVTVNENIRSSFTIKKPTVDETGKAVSIPNNGYVELLRESNGLVWRTYKQPATQVAVVPDLCSGAATTPLGWSNAVTSSNQTALPNASAARSITVADEDVNAGRMYFRKDFTVTESGAYIVTAHTASDADVAEVYVDGAAYVTTQNKVSSGAVTLSAGCHTVTVRLTNKTLLPRHSQFTAAIQRAGSEPIVATDSSWRASAGSSVHYSDVDFYADSSIWGKVTDVEMAETIVPTWGSESRDSFTRLIGASCASTCPPSSSTYFRDDKDFIVAANTDVLVSALCDDDCAVYVDGNLIIASSIWSAINQQTLTLTEGTHHVGVRLYNGGAAANPSKFGLSVVEKSTGNVLTRSDINWLTANNTWVPGTGAGNDPMSYEASFRPSPSEIPEPVVADILVIGGGGGAAMNAAGGGGGGGSRFFQEVPMTTGSKTITVGTGGAGGANSNATPGDGTFSQYMSTTYRTLGGGHGAPRSTTNILAGGGNNVFASGGGGAGAYTVANHPGGTGTNPQGGNGGAGTVMDSGCNSRGGGGGGAGGAGVAGVASGASGRGGPGYITYITGARRAFGGGGGGSGPTCGTSFGITTDGAGASANGASAAVNTGGGGTANDGSGTGGSGGSGIVIIRVKTGTMSVSVTGSPAVTTTTIKGIPYTVYTYTASGTFNPTALTP